MSEQQFESEELLREALAEVAEADLGDYVEEPWGSTALAAAEQVASDGASPELRALAAAAVERVAARSELLERVVEDDAAWAARLADLRHRLD
ncbi:MAG TPA: hypothetical protein VFJ91_09390 [Gaiellaceae bacterium]|nr:hypothetical protein [Gaiellaceae bacterium]